jgi:hypothetical protein
MPEEGSAPAPRRAVSEPAAPLDRAPGAPPPPPAELATRSISAKEADRAPVRAATAAATGERKLVRRGRPPGRGRLPARDARVAAPPAAKADGTVGGVEDSRRDAATNTLSARGSLRSGEERSAESFASSSAGGRAVWKDPSSGEKKGATDDALGERKRGVGCAGMEAERSGAAAVDAKSVRTALDGRSASGAASGVRVAPRGEAGRGTPASPTTKSTALRKLAEPSAFVERREEVPPPVRLARLRTLAAYAPSVRLARLRTLPAYPPSRSDARATPPPRMLAAALSARRWRLCHC